MGLESTTWSLVDDTDFLSKEESSGKESLMVKGRAYSLRLAVFKFLLFFFLVISG